MILESITSYCSNPGIANLIKIIKKALDLIQIIGPIIAIIGLAIILVKLMMNPEEKKYKNSIKNWLISLVMLFFIPIIVNTTMKLLDDSFELSNCWNNVDKYQGESTYIDTVDEDRKKPVLIDPSDYQPGND